MPIVVSDPGDQIAAMAERMVSTFGPRAAAVAQEQIASAMQKQPAVAETWRRIGQGIDDILVPNQGLSATP